MSKSDLSEPDVAKAGLATRILRGVSQIEANEVKATITATLFVFVLMTSYYILRPVRDSLASDWSDTEVSLLWNLNFVVSAAIVAVFGFAVSRVQLRFVALGLYGFFALTFVGFYFGMSVVVDRVLIEKIFYLWVSVFALFHVTVFWTLMADTFSKDQATRLFAIIGIGGSAGSMVGPVVAGLLADDVSLEALMLIAALGLLAVTPLVFYLHYLKRAELGNAQLDATTDGVVGGDWWRGFQAFVSNPYLLGIGAFILLYVFISSFIYFEQKNLLEEYSRAERTQILASIDGIVNLLTFGMAFFLTGRIVRRLGMGIALALIPALVCIALLILVFAPLLTVVLALQVMRRGGNYALTRPAREMLYTHVSREERQKAKPVVDIVVYRGGDAVSSSVFALFTDGLGLGLAAVGAVGAAIAAVWAWAGIRLGRVFDGKKRASQDT